MHRRTHVLPPITTIPRGMAEEDEYEMGDFEGDALTQEVRRRAVKGSVVL